MVSDLLWLGTSILLPRSNLNIFYHAPIGYMYVNCVQKTVHKTLLVTRFIAGVGKFIQHQIGNCHTGHHSTALVIQLSHRVFQARNTYVAAQLSQQ